MKFISSLLVLLIMSLPLGMAIDLPEKGTGPEKGLENPWSPCITTETDPSPWWERTVFDENGDGISDVLEPYAALSEDDSLLADGGRVLSDLSFSGDRPGEFCGRKRAPQYRASFEQPAD